MSTENLPALKSFRFQQHELREIRDEHGNPWFIAKDVCDILGIQNVSQDRFGIDEEDIHKMYIPTLSNSYTLVNESGLYVLILRSNKPEAKHFKKWVTSEVLPSIRKTGKYEVAPQYDIPKTYAEALKLAYEQAMQIEDQQRIIGQIVPKAEQFDMFMNGTNAKSIGDTAKALQQGQNRLFKFLREKNILMRNNLPKQEYIDRGYFIVIEMPIKIGEKDVNYSKTMVTPKGEAYIANLLMNTGAYIFRNDMGVSGQQILDTIGTPEWKNTLETMAQHSGIAGKLTVKIGKNSYKLHQN